MNKLYNPIKYYKKFKKEYLQFVVFVKCGKIYQTFDSDAKIVGYIVDDRLFDGTVKIAKEDFAKILRKLHEAGLNVVLVGSKKRDKFYTSKESLYLKVRAKSKEHFKVPHK